MDFLRSLGEALGDASPSAMADVSFSEEAVPLGFGVGVEPIPASFSSVPRTQYQTIHRSLTAN